jgi:peptide/nickel transport system ATP-binding protein
MTPPRLSVENLSVALSGDPRQRLLRSVSLEVGEGEVRGLVGESGAGKSMIGKTIFGILPSAAKVIEGRIAVGGRDLLVMPARERRRLVGREMALIPQDPLTALNPSRRIEAQLTDRLVNVLGESRSAARDRAAALLEEVQIRDPARVLRSYPHELSGGMRQRVLIAEAFAAEPKLIVADEPTTALDVTVQRRILSLIAAMQRRHGAALLFVTHDLGVVAKVCQSVTVLYAGKVVEEGTTDAILHAPSSPYTRALVEATPRYDRPGRDLAPVSADVIAAVRADVAAADAAYLSR